MYGLRQAPRYWFSKLSTTLKQYGFKQSYADYSLFTYASPDLFLRVLVYVGDLIVTGNNPSAISLFKTHLSTCSHMKDLGSLKYFLDIEVARNVSGLYLSQRKYTLDIISEASLSGGKPATTPVEQNHPLDKDKAPYLSSLDRYRRLVSHLIYLTYHSP